jgi:YggT family protein
MTATLIFLFKTLMDLYLLTFLLRFVMQWARTSHYNPFAQFVYKVTGPLVIPVRRVLPSIRGLDTSTLVVMIALEILATWLLLRFASLTLPIGSLLLYALLRLISLALLFYTGGVLLYVLLSWFGDRSRNPMAVLLGELVAPVLRPARLLLPPIGGLDLSPIIVIVLLQATMLALQQVAFVALPLPLDLR